VPVELMPRSMGAWLRNRTARGLHPAAVASNWSLLQLESEEIEAELGDEPSRDVAGIRAAALGEVSIETTCGYTRQPAAWPAVARSRASVRFLPPVAGDVVRGNQRETRLELATLTLARYRSNSVFERGRKWPVNDYLPPISTGIHADHTRSHADPTAVHADYKTPESWGRAVEAPLVGQLAVVRA
jgi:hypothetical protein